MWRCGDQMGLKANYWQVVLGRRWGFFVLVSAGTELASGQQLYITYFVNTYYYHDCFPFLFLFCLSK